MQRWPWQILTCSTAIIAPLLAAQPAIALEGYFQHGYGARHKALAGAGAADGRDATVIVINPAGLVHAQNEIDSAFSLFSPTREMEGSGAPGLTPTGKYESNTLQFFVPNLAAAYRVSGNPFVDVVGISVWGNGASTNYGSYTRPAPECGPNGGLGMYCNGRAGVDLQQMFLTLAIAKQITPDFSVGIAPVLARQQFRAKGLSLFAPVSNSVDGEWGYGISGGIEWSIAPNFRFGGAIASKTYMGSFEKYAHLLADHGDCDVPAYGQAGIAYDAQPNLTLMLDYQYIAYGEVACVANPATNMLFAPFGADDGPAFGWRNISAIKFGAEWRYRPDLTFRAGYAYNTPLFGSRDVQLDILAPATTQHHITGGGEWRIDKDWSLELAGMYAPETTVKGSEIIPSAAHQVEVSSEQYEITLGVKYYYDAAP
ncbi:long-chain fatty acid transport protein [Hyphomicrobium sp. 1Nfss2.1]|uniref:OmpP1/FadL family transporter n=1 Tax=Hyphomicrobium sp. 1Nfss2.1 TaxID=3413936 RepID=UPI003C7E900C